MLFSRLELECLQERGWEPIVRDFCNDEIKEIEKTYMEMRMKYITQYESYVGQAYVIDFMKRSHEELKKMRRRHSTNTSYANTLLSNMSMIQRSYFGESK